MIMIWRGSYVKHLKSAWQRIMTLSPVVQVIVIVCVIFCDAVVSGDGCFCDSGCYEHDFQTLCCDEICRDADARGLTACRQKCPGYEHIVKLKEKMETYNDDCAHEIKLWKHRADEYKKKLATLWGNYNGTLQELRKYKTKLREVESSGKLISGLVTPLCLFATLMIILCVCVCLYQKSEVCKRPAQNPKDLEGHRDNCDGFGRQKFNGSLSDPTSNDSSFMAMKPSVLDSGLIQHRSERPPEYFSGSKVGRVISHHSQTQDDTGRVMPCVACTPTPPASWERYTKPPNHFHFNSAMTQHHQLSPQRHQLQSHQQQLQQQQLQQQQQHTFAPSVHQLIAKNPTVPNNTMLVNQMGAHQLGHREIPDSGIEQARKSKKNVKEKNDATESCGLRLAKLDFGQDLQPKQPKQSMRAKNNNLASANNNNLYEENLTDLCT